MIKLKNIFKMACIMAGLSGNMVNAQIWDCGAQGNNVTT